MVWVLLGDWSYMKSYIIYNTEDYTIHCSFNIRIFISKIKGNFKTTLEVIPNSEAPIKIQKNIYKSIDKDILSQNK